MTLLYLVRHGETEWNRERRIQGRSDIPLNEVGRAQALATARALSSRKWDAVATSPLARASETADIIARELGLPAPAPIDELTERNYGEAEGFTYAELDRKYPGPVEVPGRETRADVLARVLPALTGLARESPGGNILVVSHGGVIRSVLTALGPEPGDHHSEPITNGSVHSFRYENGDFRLVQFDDRIEAQTAGREIDDIVHQNALEGREGVVR